MSLPCNESIQLTLQGRVGEEVIILAVGEKLSIALISFDILPICQRRGTPDLAPGKTMVPYRDRGVCHAARVCGHDPPLDYNER